MKCFSEYTERCLDPPFKRLVENEVYGGNIEQYIFLINFAIYRF